MLTGRFLATPGFLQPLRAPMRVGERSQALPWRGSDPRGGSARASARGGIWRQNCSVFDLARGVPS